jgi:hypothetical protein
MSQLTKNLIIITINSIIIYKKTHVVHVLKTACPTIQTHAIPAIFVWAVKAHAFKLFSILIIDGQIIIHSLHVSCRLGTSNKMTSQTKGLKK